jgi:hypothetical protein
VTVKAGAAPPHVDGLRGLAGRVARFAEPVRAAIESMTGARCVHDQLEQARWPARPTGSTLGCWPSSLAAILCRRSGCLTRRCAPSGSELASGCISSATAPFSSNVSTSCSRTASPARFRPVRCLRRALLERLALPEPWAATVEASVRLIDEVDREIDGCEAELRRLGADHRYVPLLLTIPVFFHCVTMIGFETPDLQVAVHSIAGSFIYGVLAAKLARDPLEGIPALSAARPRRVAGVRAVDALAHVRALVLHERQVRLLMPRRAAAPVVVFAASPPRHSSSRSGTRSRPLLQALPPPAIRTADARSFSRGAPGATARTPRGHRAIAGRCGPHGRRRGGDRRRGRGAMPPGMFEGQPAADVAAYVATLSQ